LRVSRDLVGRHLDDPGISGVLIQRGALVDELIQGALGYKRPIRGRERRDCRFGIDKFGRAIRKLLVAVPFDERLAVRIGIVELQRGHVALPGQRIRVRADRLRLVVAPGLPRRALRDPRVLRHETQRVGVRQHWRRRALGNTGRVTNGGRRIFKRRSGFQELARIAQFAGCTSKFAFHQARHQHGAGGKSRLARQIAPELHALAIGGSLLLCRNEIIVEVGSTLADIARRLTRVLCRPFDCLCGIDRIVPRLRAGIRVCCDVVSALSERALSLYHSLGTAPKALAKPFREAAHVREDTTHPVAPFALYFFSKVAKGFAKRLAPGQVRRRD
jgi:hypothetical protein